MVIQFSIFFFYVLAVFVDDVDDDGNAKILTKV